MNGNMFEQLDFGAFDAYIKDDDITDISYSNNGQIWLRSLVKGSYRVDNPAINNAVVEKLAFQCSNVMGTTFNMANPFLDAESAELRMNFVHDSIATNGIALVIRKTPAKIRLKEANLLQEQYVTQDIHDFLIKCVEGHCNIIVCGETGSGKTEFVKYLASHTQENEKLISIEDTLELHLDKIYPNRDIVAMKTNNIAAYSDVLVTCMRQNPKWILLAEVRSAEAVMAVRNSISSGHNILSTIHSDKASAVPHRMYSLMETDIDVEQFLKTIYRYVQLAVHIKAYYSKELQKFHREIDEVTEFFINDKNEPEYRVLYQKTISGKIIKRNPSRHLMNYLEGQNIMIKASFEGATNKTDEEIEKEEWDLEQQKFDDQVDEVKTETTSNVDNNVSSTIPIVENNVVSEVIPQPINVNSEVLDTPSIPVQQPINVEVPVQVDTPVASTTPRFIQNLESNDEFLG